MKVKVLKIFRDIYTKELYSVGRKLEIDDEDRIEDLTSRGLVEVVEEKRTDDLVLVPLLDKEFEKKVVLDALKAIGEKVAWNMKSENIVANVAALDEEKTAALKTALGIE